MTVAPNPNTPQNSEALQDAVTIAREELEEHLNSLGSCDYDNREETAIVLKDFDSWSKTAKLGDAYLYDGLEFTIDLEEER